MPYEKELDQEIESKEIEMEYNNFILSVFRYNDGAPKLAIKRIKIQGDYRRFTDIGRLRVEEAETLLPEIEGFIEKYKQDGVYEE